MDGSPIGPARRKALLLAVAMTGTAALAVVARPSRRLADERPPIRLETLFPERFGGWHAAPGVAALVRPPQDTGKLYGIYDQVLERVYLGPEGERVMLSVAYGTEQSVGLQVHRPEVCYPGGGFTVSGLERVVLRFDGRMLPATRLLAKRPGRSEPITYWTVLGDSVERDGSAFQWRQLAAGLRGRILDGMLVRVSSIDHDVARAHAQQAGFAAALVGAMEPHARARVAGKPVGG